MALPADLTTLPLPFLRALQCALTAAEAALDAAADAGGGEIALYADAEGVSVTFTVSVEPKGDL